MHHLIVCFFLFVCLFCLGFSRTTHNTVFVTPVVEHWLEREIIQRVLHERSILRTISLRSYLGVTSCSLSMNIICLKSLEAVYSVLYDWCNKGRGMCYTVCGMVHIKVPLLLIGKSSPCGGRGFPLSLSEWHFTLCVILSVRWCI